LGDPLSKARVKQALPGPPKHAGFQSHTGTPPISQSRAKHPRQCHPTQEFSMKLTLALATLLLLSACGVPFVPLI